MYFLLYYRRSELGGYKRAVESTLSLNETAFWLNTIITRLWVIESGGLEPPLSLSAKEILAESLKHPYSKPSLVAHVSLDTLTFGSSPPFISRLTVTGIDVDESIVFMELDVGLLMHDAVLLLGECCFMIYVCVYTHAWVVILPLA